MKLEREDLKPEKWGDLSPRSVLEKLDGHVDEAIWNKAKKASQDAFGTIKYPFVMYLYKKWGGK